MVSGFRTKYQRTKCQKTGNRIESCHWIVARQRQCFLFLPRLSLSFSLSLSLSHSFSFSTVSVSFSPCLSLSFSLSLYLSFSLARSNLSIFLSSIPLSLSLSLLPPLSSPSPFTLSRIEIMSIIKSKVAKSSPTEVDLVDIQQKI